MKHVLFFAFYLLQTSYIFSQDYITGRTNGLQSFSSPQQAYILSDQQLEFSVPDLSTISHLRWYVGKKEDYQWHFGVGIVLMDVGFSKIITRFYDHFPVKSKTTFGITDEKRWMIEQQLSMGLNHEKQFRNEWFSSISLTGGYKKGGNTTEDLNRFYALHEVGFSYIKNAVLFSVQGGISIHFFPQQNLLSGGYQIGFSSAYIF